MTEIDPQKLMDLRNKWIAECQAEIDATDALVQAQERQRNAYDDFIAYSTKGDAGLADLESDRETLGRQLGIGQMSIRDRFDGAPKTLGGAVGMKWKT